jgi:hypothetical protein
LVLYSLAVKEKELPQAVVKLHPYPNETLREVKKAQTKKTVTQSITVFIYKPFKPLN